MTTTTEPASEPPAGRAQHPAQRPAEHPAGERLRLLLRHGVAEPHARLDARLAGLDFAARADYARFLTASARVVPAFERALEAAGIETLLPDWPRRRRRAALAGDLTRLGLDAPPEAQPAALQGREQLLGAAYALEGSRNGAALLLRAVMRSAEPELRAATAFLKHGESEGLWPSFLRLLASQSPGPDGGARALAAARAVFEGYLAAFALPATR